MYLNTPLTLILITDFIQPVKAISGIIFLAAITVISYFLLLVFIAALKVDIFKGGSNHSHIRRDVWLLYYREDQPFNNYTRLYVNDFNSSSYPWEDIKHTLGLR